jgi:hypothetical protein
MPGLRQELPGGRRAVSLDPLWILVGIVIGYIAGLIWEAIRQELEYRKWRKRMLGE